MKVTIIHNAFGDEFITVASYTSKLANETSALNEAYRLTNSVDEAWYENPELTIPSEILGGIRSTSIDDFILIEVGDIRTWYTVASFGFDKVELDDIVEFTRYENDFRVWKNISLLELILDAELRDTKKGLNVANL